MYKQYDTNKIWHCLRIHCNWDLSCVEKGFISFHTKLKDCLEIKFPNFDEDITIHQLLTHSAGIPDYFDESIMDNFEDLWKQTPMYLLKSLKDFLSLFQKVI